MQKMQKKSCNLISIGVYFARPHQDKQKTENGVLAQLVERLNGIEKVSGSNPLCSTSTDGRQIFRESAAFFIFAYVLAGYTPVRQSPSGVKSGC